MKRVLIGLLFALGLAVPGWGQGTIAYHDIAFTLNNQGLTIPASGATISVCNPSDTALPCTNYVTVYPTLSGTNQSSSTPITQPFAADLYGNFNFWTLSCGPFVLTVTGATVLPKAYQITPCGNVSGAAITPSSISGVLQVDGTKYPQTLPGIQTALNAATPGQKVVIPGPITYSGSGAVLNIPANIEVECQGQPTLSFSGVGTSTDLITINSTFPPYRSTLKGDPCVIAGNATGRDAIHVNGGDHGTLSGLYITDAGRDFLNFTSSNNSQWFENWSIDHIRNAYTTTPSANARDAYHFELPTGLTNIYMNKFILFQDNIRGFVGRSLHWVVNNSCTGCAFDNWTIIDQESDSVGHMSSTATAPVFWDKVSGVTNPFNSYVFVGGSFEDTGLTPTGRIFSAATNASTLNGLIIEGSVNGNFPGFYDSSFFTNVSNVEQFDQGGHIIFQTLQWWKDNVPSQAAGAGMICPGGALGNDWLVCIFNSGAWSQRFDVIAGGGFGFDNTSGSAVASVDNAGSVQGHGLAMSVGTVSMAYTLTCSDQWLNVTGTTTITVPHALTCGAISQRPRWTVFNSGSGTVTIQADSGNTNGGANVTRAANTGFEVVCDGTNCFAH